MNTMDFRCVVWTPLKAMLPVCLAALVFMSPTARARTNKACHEVNATALVAAVRNGDVGTVRCMARNGANVDAGVHDDGTPLIVAARRGDLAMADALLELGANANASLRGDGNPLIAASAQGHLDVVQRLLMAGAKVDTIVPGGETALISAVRNNHLGAVRLLVEHGANVNLGTMANGIEWRSPLNQARSSGIRKYLADKGAVIGHPAKSMSIKAGT